MPELTIVIPTYNRLARLRRVLSAVRQQTYRGSGVEVVVVSDGSSDGTNEYLVSTDLPIEVRPIVQANQGVAAARNAGIAAATGDIVLFLDDDVVPSPELVAQHMRTHESAGGDVVVLGPMLSPSDFVMSPWVRWEQDMLRKQYDAMLAGEWEPTARQFYTGNTSLARRHLLAAGGFDQQFRRAEDVELAFRLARHGLRFVLNYEAVGWHYAERSFQSWLNIAHSYGRCDVIFTRDRGNAWLLPTVLYESKGRHPFVRGLIWACLGGTLRSGLAMGGLKGVVEAAEPVGARRIQRMACSGLFNLRHAQGVADELGGRLAYYAARARADHSIDPRTALLE